MPTQEDLDQIDDAILRVIKGAKTVRYADREVTSHDLSELMKARAQIAAALEAEKGIASFSRASFSRE